MSRKYNLYNVTKHEVVPVPSYGVVVEVEELLEKNLTFDDALKKAGEQSLNNQRICRIREQG